MTTPLPTSTAPPAPLETGTVRWFNAAKKIGVITRGDGSTIFIPPYGLAEGQEPLVTGQPVAFVVKTNAKGLYAANVRATGEAPPTIDNLILQIAAALGETVPQAHAQLRRIIRQLGAEATWGFVAEAQRVEAAGGMLLSDGSRRRTLGGVFFVLVRDSLAEAQRAIVFPPLYAHKTKQTRPSGEAPVAEPAPPLPLAWEDRIAVLQTLRAQSGKATTVKVTIIGRPGQIEERPQVTLLTLTHTGPLPALPKGIPTPDPVPPTTYSVYIGKKQWKTVAEALANPDDVLVVEGTQVLDPATGTIAVFATKTTTKLLQQASRPPKADPAG